MMNRLSLTAAVSILSAQVIACDDTPLSIEVIESGLYKVHKESSIPYQGLPSNSLINKARLGFVEETAEIPAKLGSALGYKYRLQGGTSGDRVELTVVMKYPEPGVKDPGTGMIHTKDRYTIPAIVGDTSTTFYSFDGEWELVSGEWTRELWHGCNKLASRTYKVVK
jgi:hypothetical protein